MKYKDSGLSYSLFPLLYCDIHFVDDVGKRDIFRTDIIAASASDAHIIAIAFSEIGFLSINGAIPVVGGITGGIVADRLTDKEGWKDKITDKIKEGSYQYLANIFMCNIGAGAALGILEKMNITYFEKNIS